MIILTYLFKVMAIILLVIGLIIFWVYVIMITILENKKNKNGRSKIY